MIPGQSPDGCDQEHDGTRLFDVACAARGKESDAPRLLTLSRPLTL